MKKLIQKEQNLSKIQNLTKPEKHIFTNQAYEQLNNRFLAFFVALLIITLTVMSILAYGVYKSASDEFRIRDERSFESVTVSIDSDLAIIDYYSKNLLQNNMLNRLSHMNIDEEGFLLNGMYLKKDLNSALLTSGDLPVSSYHIFFRNSDYVASVNVFSPMEHFWERFYKAAKDNSYWYDAQFANNGNGTVWPLFELNINNNNDYIYLVDLDSLTRKSCPVTVGYLIDSTKLVALFDNVALDSGDFIYVTDNQGNVIFYINDQYDCQPAPDNLLEAVDKADYTYETVSAFNGWTYHLVKSNIQKPFILFIAFFLLIITFVAGIYIIFRLINPIAQLDDELTKTNQEKDELENVVKATTPVVNRMYLKQLMKSTFSSEAESRYIRGFLQLDDDSLQFYVIYGVYYQNGHFDTDEEAMAAALVDPDKVLDIVNEALAASLSYKDHLYLWPVSDKNFAVLVPFSNSISPDEELLNLQNKVISIHDSLLSEHSIWLLTGIGSVCSYDNIWESYQQARDASSYTNKNYIFLPYSLMKKNSTEYYFPMELSNRMVQFITSGNKASVTELFHLIYKENIEDRALSYALLTYLLSDIRNTILKARFKLENLSLSSELIATTDALFTEEPTFNSCKDAALKLCDAVATSKSNSSENPVADIVEYINANYSDPSMSLSKISEKFNISESYFSHMFKDSMHINFSTYLEDLRLNEAARLIKEREKDGQTLSEIAESVGYNSIVSFRRAFKKKFNVTPTALEEDK